MFPKRNTEPRKGQSLVGRSALVVATPGVEHAKGSQSSKLEAIYRRVIWTWLASIPLPQGSCSPIGIPYGSSMAPLWETAPLQAPQRLQLETFNHAQAWRRAHCCRAATSFLAKLGTYLQEEDLGELGLFTSRCKSFISPKACAARGLRTGLKGPAG